MLGNCAGKNCKWQICRIIPHHVLIKKSVGGERSMGGTPELGLSVSCFYKTKNLMHDKLQVFAVLSKRFTEY